VNWAEHLNSIRNNHFDVLVVGGGITGAGIALDAALRGLSVALLERIDFGAGTSGVSSKMVHAGLRYIFGDPDLVREASRERQHLFYACAHLARPLEYILPCYSGVRQLIRQVYTSDKQMSESEVSRAHHIWQTLSYVWAISGGKFTKFRLMAEQLVDRVGGDLQNKAIVGKLQPCSTATRRYHGSPALTVVPGESEIWITSMACKVKS
jgi:glycerol-3-phosphate dehydrogenase